jgi:hypothetical protein
VSKDKIKRLAKRHYVGNIFDTSLNEALDNLSQATKEYIQCKKIETATELRAKERRPLAEARALDKGTTTEGELKKMMNIEAQRKLSRRIKRTLGTDNRKPVLKLFSAHTGTRTEYSDKQSMEEASIIENEARFSLAHDTPLMQEPLLSEIGLMADTPTAQSILNGGHTNLTKTRIPTRKNSWRRCSSHRISLGYPRRQTLFQV